LLMAAGAAVSSRAIAQGRRLRHDFEGMMTGRPPPGFNLERFSLCLNRL
jgi:hypothetical protein